MLALQVVIEHVSAFDPERKQHYLYLPYKLPLKDLTRTILHKVGFRNLDKYNIEGRLQIGVLKPLPFNAVTDNLDDTIGHLLMAIISSVIVYIKLKKLFDSSNEEERLEYREMPLLRGTGYLIGEYFYVCDRQSDRKDTVYLRCSRQRKGECPSRAKILRDLRYAVLVNKNHNHPPPNVKNHEFMHRCRNESREPKNFKRQLKDVYDEIHRDMLANCSPDELSELQTAIPDWDTVKKVMQKCRSRAVCSAPKLEREDSVDCERTNDVSLSGPQSIQKTEKTKRQRLDKYEADVGDNGGLVRPQSNSQSLNHNILYRNTALYQSIRLPTVTGTQLATIVPGNGVPILPRDPTIMVHTDDGITSESLPVGPMPLIGAPSMSHQGYTNHCMNSAWTTTADNFMLNVQAPHAN
ncbi:uncharacterized protein LOC117100528 isoform X2 [Anneissia japonica]|nr:uncharacterized protein LOC117100528 isoform X2 [Anneissia japonica]